MCACGRVHDRGAAVPRTHVRHAFRSRHALRSERIRIACCLTHHVANISTVVQAADAHMPQRAQRRHLARAASVTRLRLKCLGLVWAVRVS